MKYKTVVGFAVLFVLMSASLESQAMPVHTNRLANEKSPYLLQHAHNPVDWYPWGEEAFEKAKKENKPVFLSVGYSTCHWCHVMEEESFENEETARVMNEHFVSIKVDREERPDIDGVYMSYVMAVTGSGGWPMSAFLTPDKKPFYGGTYFPPEDRYGMPGFRTLLLSIADAWKNRRDEILTSAESAAKFLAEPKPAQASAELSAKTLEQAWQSYEASFDAEWGGFGHAPKFPRSHALSMILRHWKRSRDPKALEAVRKTLDAMAAGGLYDQLGGGFHRYSTDGRWRVPHFEKMLYDQALLARTYLEAFQATKDPEDARVARETLDYVLREMTGPEGAFYSAQDADSEDPAEPGRKREGAFYVWTKTEIDRVLGKDSAAFCAYYGVEEGGNAVSDPQGEFKNQNVLYRAGLDASPVDVSISRKKLFEVRAQRPRPHLDDKVLTDWNGLMIDAFSFASRVLDEPRYRAAAVRSAEFVLKNMKNDRGRLLHRWRDGEAAIPANLNDYAFLVYGFLSLYEATFETRWLDEARAAADPMLKFFLDEKTGGFYLTASDAETFLARPKEFYDGAVPSGNSVAVLDLILLSRFLADEHYSKYADDALKGFSGTLAADPANYSQMLVALDFAAGPSSEIVIAAAPGDAEAGKMVREIYSRFLPGKVVMFHAPGEEGRAAEKTAPFLADKTPVGGKAAAYVCQNHACKLPATNVEALKKLLETG